MNKLPKTEKLWLSCYTPKGVLLISSNADRSRYTLGREVENEIQKLKTGKSPKHFEKEEEAYWNHTSQQNAARRSGNREKAS